MTCLHHMSIYVSRRVLPLEKSVFGKELAKHGIHSSQHWDSGVRDTYYLLKGALEGKENQNANSLEHIYS